MKYIALLLAGIIAFTAGYMIKIGYYTTACALSIPFFILMVYYFFEYLDIGDSYDEGWKDKWRK